MSLSSVHRTVRAAERAALQMQLAQAKAAATQAQLSAESAAALLEEEKREKYVRASTTLSTQKPMHIEDNRSCVRACHAKRSQTLALVFHMHAFGSPMCVCVCVSVCAG